MIPEEIYWGMFFREHAFFEKGWTILPSHIHVWYHEGLVIAKMDHKALVILLGYHEGLVIPRRITRTL